MPKRGKGSEMNQKAPPNHSQKDLRGSAKNFSLDPVDRLILNEIQKKFPVSHRPFLALARRLKLKERDIIERVQNMKEAGIIRRIGAIFNSRALGFTSTLCAAKVPKKKIKKFVAAVDSFPGVTHNYEREGKYNIWFTLIAPSPRKIDRILEEIRQKTGVEDILNLPAWKTFKIAVDFHFE